MRDAYGEIQAAGGELVAIGTGNPSLARSVAEDYRLPYPVLVDADGRAARAASIARVPFWRLFHPASYAGTRRAWRAGHRIGVSGKRVDQLGASFVLAPGPALVYEHRDAHSADHAPTAEVLEALRGS